MSNDVVERMRQDFPLAARALDWSESDQQEIRAEVNAAIDAGDRERVLYWAWRFSEAATWWRELMTVTAQRLRAFEARVKEEARAAAAQEEERRLAA